MPHQNRHSGTPRRGAFALLVLAALGIIYGDIGTSPLYAFQAAFGPDIGLTVDQPSVLGALSLFVWALIIVVTIKYVIVVMRASNNGEGGTLALGALVEHLVQGRRRALVIGISMLAIALFAADAVLTPSVSVLSAIEGASLISSGFEEHETEIALVILTLLFLMQRWGTGSIGRVFGPIMLLWFAVIATLGIVQIVQHPGVLEAAVIGAPDADGLTKTRAYVVCKPGVTLSAEELKAFVKDRLAPYKYPRVIEFVDELPKTATGKIQRFKLRELALQNP